MATRGKRRPLPTSTRQAGQSLGPALDFLRALWAVDHGLARLSSQMERTIGVTGPQRLVLRLVNQLPGIGPADLAAVLQVHRSVATGLIRRIEAKGLVRREPDPQDARRWRLSLTEAGVRVNATDKGTIEARVRQVVAGASGAEAAVAVRLLERLAGALAADL